MALWHDSAQKASVEPPATLLPSFQTALTWTLSSPGPKNARQFSSWCALREPLGHTFCCCLWSFNTSSTSVVNVSDPRRCVYRSQSPSHKRFDTQLHRTFNAPIICSGAIVFFDSCSHISFASDDIKCINSIKKAHTA